VLCKDFSAPIAEREARDVACLRSGMFSWAVASKPSGTAVDTDISAAATRGVRPQSGDER